MLARSEMTVVFMLSETISLGRGDPDGWHNS